MVARLHRLPPLPPFPSYKPKHIPAVKDMPTAKLLNLNDPAVEDIWIKMGRRPQDWKIAKRVAKWQQQYPQGTIPELVTLDWLEQNNVQYTYQAWVSGGRSRKGGVIPDFVLQANGKGMAWMIQGEYWHTRPEVKQSDAIDKLTLIGHYFEHILIEKVIELWELDIYNRRPQVFDWAMLGIGLRG